MRTWLHRIAGVLQIAGGFLGATDALKNLLYNNLQGTAFIIVAVVLALYGFVLLTGIMLLESHAKAGRLSLIAQGLQIPFISFPFFGYKFLAGFSINLYWIGNAGGISYPMGSEWMFLLHGSNTWGIGINALAAVLFFLLWRYDK